LLAQRAQRSSLEGLTQRTKEKAPSSLAFGSPRETHERGGVKNSSRFSRDSNSLPPFSRVRTFRSAALQRVLNPKNLQSGWFVSFFIVFDLKVFKPYRIVPSAAASGGNKDRLSEPRQIGASLAIRRLKPFREGSSAVRRNRDTPGVSFLGGTPSLDTQRRGTNFLVFK
jgi:hypothetical protein